MNNFLFEKNFPPQVVAFMSGRSIDFSLQTQGRDFTDLQKGYLSQHKDKLDPKKYFCVHQVHGARVISVTESICEHNNFVLNADGVVTNLKNVALCIRTADCLPVFIYDSIQEVIGLVHAGWRGTKERILSCTLERFQEEFGSNIENIKCAFGPSIQSCCYEVGEEFQENFSYGLSQKEGRWFLDLKEINKSQALEAGVLADQIVASNQCTCCQMDYFSFRREGQSAGRHLSLIYLQEYPLNLFWFMR